MQAEVPLFGWFGRALRTSLQGTTWKSPPDCPPQSLAGGQVLRLMATGAAHVHGSSVSDSARVPCKQPIIHNVAADATVCTRPDTDQA